MSSEDGVPPINCFSVSLPYGLAPHSRPNLTVPPVHPKKLSPSVVLNEEVTMTIQSAYKKGFYMGCSKNQF